jgi:hypothetical protein
MRRKSNGKAVEAGPSSREALCRDDNAGQNAKTVNRAVARFRKGREGIEGAGEGQGGEARRQETGRANGPAEAGRYGWCGGFRDALGLGRDALAWVRFFAALRMTA